MAYGWMIIRYVRKVHNLPVWLWRYFPKTRHQTTPGELTAGDSALCGWKTPKNLPPTATERRDGTANSARQRWTRLEFSLTVLGGWDTLAKVLKRCCC